MAKITITADMDTIREIAEIKNDLEVDTRPERQ